MPHSVPVWRRASHVCALHRSLEVMRLFEQRLPEFPEVAKGFGIMVIGCAPGVLAEVLISSPVAMSFRKRLTYLAQRPRSIRRGSQPHRPFPGIPSDPALLHLRVGSGLELLFHARQLNDLAYSREPSSHRRSMLSLIIERN